MLRRTKATVDIAVPPRDELTLFLPMSEAQRFWTYRLLTRLDSGELEAIFAPQEGEAEDDSTGPTSPAKEANAYIASKLKESKSGQNR